MICPPQQHVAILEPRRRVERLIVGENHFSMSRCLMIVPSTPISTSTTRPLNKSYSVWRVADNHDVDSRNVNVATVSVIDENVVAFKVQRHLCLLRLPPRSRQALRGRHQGAAARPDSALEIRSS